MGVSGSSLSPCSFVYCYKGRCTGVEESNSIWSIGSISSLLWLALVAFHCPQPTSGVRALFTTAVQSCFIFRMLVSPLDTGSAACRSYSPYLLNHSETTPRTPRTFRSRPMRSFCQQFSVIRRHVVLGDDRWTSSCRTIYWALLRNRNGATRQSPTPPCYLITVRRKCNDF